MAAATSLLTLSSIVVRADSPDRDDIYNWLTHETIATDANRGMSIEDTYLGKSANNESLADQYESKTLTAGSSFATKVSKSKSDGQRFLNKLSDKLKLTLFNNKGRKSNQRFYVNTLDQELVGKFNYGRARYELRFNDEQAQVNYSYDF